MFDAVQRREKVSARRVGAGGALAIALHVCVVLVIVRYGTCAPRDADPPRDVVFKQALMLPARSPPPPPPPPPPLGGGATPAAPQPRKPVPVKRTKVTVAPRQNEPEKPREPEKPSEAAGVAGGQDGGVAGGQVGGVAGGQVGGVAGGQVGGALGSPTPTAQPVNLTLPFGEGTTPPRLIAGAAHPQYTREALEARVEGKVIARCTLTAAGTLTDCRLLKGLQHLDQVVLSTLAGQRYTPVMYQGHPQSVYYTFTFRFQLP